jgi:uncharacterized protein (DUF1697 family)
MGDGDMKYAAFLRGINVGGNTQIKMEELRRVFASFGFRNVRTLLNSGNVIFEAAETDAPTLAHGIERTLEQAFGFKSDVILRTAEEIQAIVASEPFAGVTVTPATRLYITLVGAARADGHGSGLSIPYESPAGDFLILRVVHGAICSVLTLSPQRGTVDLMKFIEQAFGKRVTTRSWNTIIKVQQSMK